MKRISVTVTFIVAMLVIGTVGVSTASAVGGKICSASGPLYVKTINPFYNVENSVSAGGSSCLTVSSTAEAFHVDSTSYDPSAPGADNSDPYNGFKAIYTGCRNGSCLEPQYPILASALVSEPTSWTFSNNFSAINGQFDAIYDAFFNTTTKQQFLPNGGELEIFLNYTSNETALGGTQLPDTTIGGQTYHVWSAVKSASGTTWTRIAFQRTSTNRTTSVSNLDVAGFVKAAIADGAINPNWYQQDLDAGFEIWSGGVGLATSSFSAPPPTVTAANSAGGGGSGSSGGGSSGGGSSGGGGTKTKTKAVPKTTKPHASLAMPECSTKWSRTKCNAFRRTAGAWRYAYGFASAPDKMTKVVVTAYRAKQKNAKALTISLKAKFVGKTAWKVHLGTLTKGNWRFSAVVTDKAGKKATSNVVKENINLGLAANAPIAARAPK